MALTDLIPWRRPMPMRPGWEMSPLHSLQREMNRMFEDLWSDGGSRLLRTVPAEGVSSFTMFFPDIDISESNGYVDVVADVPGITDKDITLNLSEDGETLTIEGEKKVEREAKGQGTYVVERRHGKFRRVVSLPSRVDNEEVEAKCHNGVLQVHMKKLPEKEQHIKQIPIKAD